MVDQTLQKDRELKKGLGKKKVLSSRSKAASALKTSKKCLGAEQKHGVWNSPCGKVHPQADPITKALSEQMAKKMTIEANNKGSKKIFGKAHTQQQQTPSPSNKNSNPNPAYRHKEGYWRKYRRSMRKFV